MPTTRRELQSLPKEWFDLQMNVIISHITRDIKYAARTQSYFKHDVLQHTRGTGVYLQSPRIVVEDVLEGLKREFPDCDVTIQREDDRGRGIIKLYIRVDWGSPEVQ